MSTPVHLLISCCFPPSLPFWLLFIIIVRPFTVCCPSLLYLSLIMLKTEHAWDSREGIWTLIWLEQASRIKCQVPVWSFVAFILRQGPLCSSRWYWTCCTGKMDWNSLSCLSVPRAGIPAMCGDTCGSQKTAFESWGFGFYGSWGSNLRFGSKHLHLLSNLICHLVCILKEESLFLDSSGIYFSSPLK